MIGQERDAGVEESRVELHKSGDKQGEWKWEGDIMTEELNDKAELSVTIWVISEDVETEQ